MARKICMILCLLLLMASTTNGTDYTKGFLEDLKEVKVLYDSEKYENAIVLIEKYDELIGFYHLDAGKFYPHIIEARNLLGDCNIRTGNFKKAFDVFQETNGVTADSDSYALYQTALFTLLFDDIYSITDILSGRKIYYLDPDPGLYILLLSVMERDEGKLTPEKIETSLKNSKEKIVISANGRALVDFLRKRINEDELLAKTDAENHNAIKYFIGLKNERYSGSVQKGKEYYKELYNKSKDLYKWLAAKRLGLYGILIKDYENYYSYGDEWVFIKSSSTLLGKTKPYHVKEIMDNDPKTAWVEGKADDGMGEWVEFTFEPKRTLKSISFVNGYAKNEILYWANNRLKIVRITFDDGTYFDEELKDGILNSQRIILPRPKLVGKIRLTILDTYKGTKYNDTCISEVIFE